MAWDVFWRVFIKPKETLPEVVAAASFKSGAKIYFLFGVVFGLLLALLVMALGGLVSAFVPDLGKFVAAFGLVSLVLLPVGLGLFEVVTSVIAMGVMYVIARLFGGKAGFGSFFGTMAVLAVPVVVAYLIASFIPLLGPVLSLVLFFYNVYLYVLAYKAVFGFSTLRALVAYLLVPILIVVLLVVIMVSIVMPNPAMLANAARAR